jgi:hypothetical protein
MTGGLLVCLGADTQQVWPAQRRVDSLWTNENSAEYSSCCRRRSARTLNLPDVRDHNPNLSTASSQLREPQGRRPAVLLDRWGPLVTGGAPTGPLRHGPSADRGGSVPLVSADASRCSGPPRPGTRIGWPGTARPIIASTERPPAPKARSSRIATWGSGERRSLPAPSCCPWVSDQDRINWAGLEKSKSLCVGAPKSLYPLPARA